jgi:hypothetical protein
MYREILKSPAPSNYNRTMSTIVSKALLLGLAFVVMSDAHAQKYNRRPTKEVERPPAAAPVDKRDTVVTAAGSYSGKPYWLALSQCGGVYFRLNTLYTDEAVRARVVKPDPRANAEYSKKLTEAIKTATAYFTAAESFLMTDRGIERADAVLIYDAQSRAAGDRLKTIDAALTGAKVCPALYQACGSSFPKACSEPIEPMS